MQINRRENVDLKEGYQLQNGENMESRKGGRKKQKVGKRNESQISRINRGISNRLD